MSLLRLILEYGVACWDPYREGQISVLDRVQKKVTRPSYEQFGLGNFGFT